MNGSTAGIGSTVGESSPTVPIKEKLEESFEPFCLNMEHVPVEEPSTIVKPSLRPCEFHIRNEIETVPNVEHQFIPTSFAGKSPVHQSFLKEDLEFKSLSELRNEPDEDNFVSLHLGEPEAKRRKHSNSSLSLKN